ncbi:MAG: LON peptidase substrate-binding domain-containing protein [Actinobacteria bacterium]|nr:LON peptidase substrate-binding domain-containing protein [Actinomycetota bacterium]
MTATPMFPLEVAMLPGEELPLRIFEPRYTALVQACLAAEQPEFGVVMIAAGREVGGGDRRCDIGALARIVECDALGGGRYRLACLMTERIRVRQWLDDDPYPRAAVEPWDDEPADPVAPSRIDELEQRIVGLFERIAQAREVDLPDRAALLGPRHPDTGKRLYTLASRLPIGQADRYAVLSAPTAPARLNALSEALDTVVAMVEFRLSP